MTDSAEADSTPPQQPKSTGGAARVTPLGIYDKPRPDAITSIEVIAIALSAISVSYTHLTLPTTPYV